MAQHPSPLNIWDSLNPFFESSQMSGHLSARFIDRSTVLKLLPLLLHRHTTDLTSNDLWILNLDLNSCPLESSGHRNYAGSSPDATQQFDPRIYSIQLRWMLETIYFNIETPEVERNAKLNTSLLNLTRNWQLPPPTTSFGLSSNDMQSLGLKFRQDHNLMQGARIEQGHWELRFTPSRSMKCWFFPFARVTDECIRSAEKEHRGFVGTLPWHPLFGSSKHHNPDSINYCITTPLQMNRSQRKVAALGRKARKSGGKMILAKKVVAE
ncbi:hypothetical protein C8F04DRAFT_1192141 [Mycena alexandri]|uniref:Uncharacterized protein n=1 Tax=Mycena alexandri TaxID=1745969 RepID=A0AAD6SDK4_9AGAR|nr:hypothetical protein C8F04DRAFT_1192141 [Mycena alexandri]